MAGVIFRKQSPTPEPAADPTETSGVSPDGKKGHATPKRRESQAARQRPLVVNDRKRAKADMRKRRDEAYAKQHQAMTTGDPRMERFLPVRDRGPVRRFARDYVDARYSIGELFMPIAILILLVMVVGGSYPQIAVVLTISMYGLVILGILDGVLMSVFLKRRLRERFDEEDIPRWTGGYAFQRAFMLRRFRMPRAQVKRGQWPHK